MTPNANKGAFPIKTTQGSFNPGFTKREYIAIEMLKTVLLDDVGMDRAVEEAIQLTDKLLNALEK